MALLAGSEGCDHLISRADAALYEAKAEGRNLVRLAAQGGSRAMRWGAKRSQFDDRRYSLNSEGRTVARRDRNLSAHNRRFGAATDGSEKKALSNKRFSMFSFRTLSVRVAQQKGKIMKRIEPILIACIIAAVAGVAATASETITYSYDARGRLVQVKHGGTVNNNVTANYQYDKADNRTNVNVTSPNPAP